MALSFSVGESLRSCIFRAKGSSPRMTKPQSRSLQDDKKQTLHFYFPNMLFQKTNILKIKQSNSWFTLVELMIAMTIFGMMSVMVMTIYFSTTSTTRKLNAQRELAETAREIVERISEDVRERGFSGTALPFGKNEAWIAWSTHDQWLSYDYTGSGSEYLNLNNGRYVYGAKKTGILGWIDECIWIKKTDPRLHCWLYLVNYTDNGSLGYNLVDSFTPDESRKRVKIANLRFYVSGDGVNTAHKVLLSMDLALIPRNGISAALASTTTLHIQTTISERGWRK